MLYFNGNLQGLYLLAEKNDRKLFGLNKTLQNNTDDSLIFNAKDPSNFYRYEADKWEQDWPNEDEGYYIMDDVMTDLKNEEEGNDTSIDRTRRLFYVTCSRAEKSLAIIAYSSNPEMVKQHVLTNGWFEEIEIENLAL